MLPRRSRRVSRGIQERKGGTRAHIGILEAQQVAAAVHDGEDGCVELCVVRIAYSGSRLHRGCATQHGRDVLQIGARLAPGREAAEVLPCAGAAGRIVPVEAPLHRLRRGVRGCLWRHGAW